MFRSALRFAGIAGVVASVTAGAPAQAQAPSSPPLGVRVQLPAAPPLVTPAPPIAIAGATVVGDSLSATSVSAVAAERASGPTAAATSVGVRAPALSSTAVSSSALLQTRRGFGQSQVLMIVGGATFLTGAIIGDDAGTIIMIGGAAIGLYGLYQYLQGR